MKNSFRQLTVNLPWLIDALLSLGGATLFFALFFWGIAGSTLNLKLILFSIFGLLVLGVFSTFLIRDIITWVRAMRRPLTPHVLPLTLPSDHLKGRLTQLRELLCSLNIAEDDPMQVYLTDKRACWTNDFTLDLHFLKHKWCAGVSLTGGGTLLPLQLKRIATHLPCKLPERFLTSQLTSCILSWEKNQLHIFPADVAPNLLSELIPGLLSEKQADFEEWLKAYKQTLIEDSETEAQ